MFGINSRLITASILTTAVLCSGNLIQAQNKQEHIETHSLTARDRWPIKITYYKQAEDKNAPVIVMLHDKQGDQRVWAAGYADDLWGRGFAVITVDLRKHGESKLETTSGTPSDVGDLKPDDYKKMVTYDMEAVKKFIFEEHQDQNLNMRKMGIVAPEMSAIVALNYAMIDWQKIPYDDAPTPQLRTPRGQDVRAMVLISPERTVPGLTSADPLRLMKNGRLPIAFLICVGEKDSQDRGEARKLYSQLSGRNAKENDLMYYQTYPNNLRGMSLFGKNLKIELHIAAFLEKHLLEQDVEWVDRRSKLQR